MIGKLLRHGILGINARNLLYIRPFNRRQAMQLADSKLRTKLVLGGRGIPVSPLLHVIRSIQQLDAFDWHAIGRSFVIKPNRGFGGEGILVTKRLKGGRITDAGGRLLTDEAMRAHVRSILDGRFSLANLPDVAIIEQKIHSPPLLQELAPTGLPDIRIIVFNLIPVIAMIRLPTAESDGKANLHQGGLAVGLDIATGTGTYGFHHGRLVDTIPGTDRPIRSIAIPGWDRILLLASRVQRISNVGYLAVDIALSKSEQPLVLEMNARGGLSIQLANRVPLRSRLERVAGLRVKTPEHGVRLGKELFGAQIEREIERVSGREVLGRVEQVLLRLPHKREQLLPAQIDVAKARSVIDQQLAIDLGFALSCPVGQGPRTPQVKLRLRLGAKDLRTVVLAKDLAESKYKLVIGARDLVDFLIDPLKKSAEPAAEPVAKRPTKLPPRQSVDPGSVDARLGEIDRQLRVLPQVTPLNSRTELERFLVDPRYNPRFVYPPVSAEVEELEKVLDGLECGRGAIGEILDAKRSELLERAHLLRTVGTEDFTASSLALYPLGTDADQQEARATPMAFSTTPPGKLLATEDVAQEVQSFIWQLGLDWKVRISPSQSAEFSVTKGHTLFVRKGVWATKERIRGVIAHEIETHIFTVENGRRQPYAIFTYGFARFLQTQEGLADAIKARTRSPGEDAAATPWALSKYLAVLDAQHGSFAEVAERARSHGMNLQQSFNTTLRVKRGLTDTSKPGGFTKDAIYWLGRREVEAWVSAGGDLRELFVGKISLAQLPLVRRIPNLVPAAYLPQVLQHRS